MDDWVEYERYKNLEERIERIEDVISDMFYKIDCSLVELRERIEKLERSMRDTNELIY